MIVGVDEVGYGPLAGPVYAACAALKPGMLMPVDVTDSKKLSAKKREVLAARIHEACYIGLGMATPEEIDTHNVLQATHLAMQRAMDNMLQQCLKDDRLCVTQVFVDGVRAPFFKGVEQHVVKAVVGGDGLIDVVGAASIVAKVARDQVMDALHHDFPVYHFSKNKGYGTYDHIAALQKWGPCIHHRRSFAPLSNLIANSLTIGIKK